MQVRKTFTTRDPEKDCTSTCFRDETLCLRSIDFILNYADANGKYCVDIPSPIENTAIGHPIDGEVYLNKEAPNVRRSFFQRVPPPELMLIQFQGVNVHEKNAS